jgi:MycE methyltransferase N-terminal
VTTNPAHHDIRTLIRAAEGSDRELADAAAAVGPARTAELLAGELAARADLHQVAGLDDAPILVRLELRHDGDVVLHHVRAAKVTEHAAGPGDNPHATITMALTDLLRSVFGPWRGENGHNVRIHWHDLEAPDRLGAAMHVFPVVQRLVRGLTERAADLAELSIRNGSDKWGLHYYTAHYERHFAPLRDQPLSVLELGIGGFGNPASGGGSLRMWKRYFPRAVLYGVDLFDKAAIREPRIHTVQGDLSDPAFLASLGAEHGPFDIVIDDGSHASPDVITAFGALFPHVRTGGLYVIEDLQTSYWPGYGGSSADPADPRTSMGLLKQLLDGLNHEEREPGTHTPALTDTTITGMHFYPSLAVLEKGVNAEGPSPSWIPRTLMTHEEMTAVDWGEGLAGDAAN